MNNSNSFGAFHHDTFVSQKVLFIVLSWWNEITTGHRNSLQGHAMSRFYWDSDVPVKQDDPPTPTPLPGAYQVYFMSAERNVSLPQHLLIPGSHTPAFCHAARVSYLDTQGSLWDPQSVTSASPAAQRGSLALMVKALHAPFSIPPVGLRLIPNGTVQVRMSCRGQGEVVNIWPGGDVGCCLVGESKRLQTLPVSLRHHRLKHTYSCILQPTVAKLCLSTNANEDMSESHHRHRVQVQTRQCSLLKCNQIVKLLKENYDSIIIWRVRTPFNPFVHHNVLSVWAVASAASSDYLKSQWQKASRAQTSHLTLILKVISQYSLCSQREIMLSGGVNNYSHFFLKLICKTPPKNLGHLNQNKALRTHKWHRKGRVILLLLLKCCYLSSQAADSAS